MNGACVFGAGCVATVPTGSDLSRAPAQAPTRRPHPPLLKAYSQGIRKLQKTTSPSCTSMDESSNGLSLCLCRRHVYCREVTGVVRQSLSVVRQSLSVVRQSRSVVCEQETAQMQSVGLIESLHCRYSMNLLIVSAIHSLCTSSVSSSHCACTSATGTYRLPCIWIPYPFIVTVFIACDLILARCDFVLARCELVRCEPVLMRCQFIK